MFPKTTKFIILLTFNLLIISYLNAQVDCANGMAGMYPCANINLKSLVNSSALNLGAGNDIWGWQSPDTQREYAIVGTSGGTVFVDVTDGENPWIIGRLATPSSSSSWRDVKVYEHYAYIGSEASSSGIQVFDLSKLDTYTNSNINNIIFEEEDNTVSDYISKSHNVVVGEDLDLLVAVGTNRCSGGLVFYDLANNPADPPQVGCFSADGYTHDAVCFVYRGPDLNYVGQEICIALNEDTYTIVDVTNRSNPVQLSRTGYTGSSYTHQGWITDDHRYLIVNDETDERNTGINTRTYIFDISDLNNPSSTPHHIFNSTERAIDHNLYVRGSYVYQSNYRAGLRILDISKLDNRMVTEVAYFDVYPNSNSANFNGAWSVYPYFNSNKILINGIEQGLFVVEPELEHFVIEKTDNGIITGNRGQNIDYTLNLVSLGGFSGEVSFSASGLPVGATASFKSTNLLAKTMTPTTITIQLPASTTPGNYSILLEGRADGSPIQKIALGLVVENNPLSIDYLSFEAREAAISNQLSWETATEISTEQHQIQRSVTGEDNWETIGTIAAKGNSQTVQRYEWEDRRPLQNSFYRIATRNEDGTTSHSAIILVKRTENDKSVLIFPNPVDKMLQIRYESDIDTNTQLQLVNTLGEVIQSLEWPLEKGLNYQEIATSTLPSGVYFLVKDGALIQRLIKK